MEQHHGGGTIVEVIRLAVVALFVAVGYTVTRQAASDPTSASILIGTMLGALAGYVIGGVLGRALRRLAGVTEARLAAVPGADFVAGGIGALAGALIGSAVAWPLLFLPSRAVGVPTMGLVVIVLGYLGLRVGLTKREDLLQLAGLTYRTRAGDLRVLDTSAVLDTRLLSFVRAGLIRGALLLPTFVLEEAQGIADLEDPVRRKRAHRGLEALDAIRHEGLVELRPVTDRTYPQFDEVDAKVIALARERGAAIVTDDAALARIAELQGIEVLFLRRMSEAFRMQAVPGERVNLEIVRAGSKPGQGVGYLDDGSMIVVEGGGASIGQALDVTIDRSVKTGGGTLLFARVAEEE